MTCEKIRRHLSAYLDAELPAETRTLFRQHLRGCDKCQSDLESLKTLAALTEKWAQAQPPASLGKRLANELKSACKAAARARETNHASSALGNQRATYSKKTFKPVVEGLEDRYPLSTLLGSFLGACTPSPVSFAAAYCAAP